MTATKRRMKKKADHGRCWRISIQFHFHLPIVCVAPGSLSLVLLSKGGCFERAQFNELRSIP
eukprot:scaffold5057_cov134-Skeletonema_marinoi.AAC.23